MSVDVNLCLEAGLGAESDECELPIDPTEEGLPCEPGLRCFDGSCVAPCAFDPDNPEFGCGADVCIPVFQGAGDNWPGICGESCSAFTVGACGQDSSLCTLLTDGAGESASVWYCQDFADFNGDFVGTSEVCDTAADPITVCSEGHFCEPADSDGICVQYCDPTEGSDAALANCPWLPGDALLGAEVGATEVGKASEYAVVDASLSLVDLWEVDGTELRHTTIDDLALSEGIAYSVIALHSAETAVVEDWTTDSQAPASDQVGVTIYNLTDEPIDVFGALFELVLGELESGDSAAELTVAATADTDLGLGFYAKGRLADTTPWTVFSSVGGEDLNVDDYVELLLIGDVDPEGDGNPAEIVPVPVVAPALGDRDAALQVVHASASTGPIDVDWLGTTSGDQDDLGFGETTSDWRIKNVPADSSSSNISLTLSWDDDGGDSTTLSVEFIAPDDVITVVFWDNPDGSDRELMILRPGTPVGDSIQYRFTNLSHRDVNVARVAGGLGFDVGQRYPVTGATFTTRSGPREVVVRASNDDPSDPFLYEGASVNFVDGDVTEMLFEIDADEAPYLLDWIIDVPELPGAGTGEALLRLVNAASGAEDILMRDRLQLSCVEGTVPGLGTCRE